MGYKDPDKQRAWARENYSLNKERIRERQRIWRNTSITHKASYTLWREKNKEKWSIYMKEYLKKRREANSKWWYEYKSQFMCLHCGESRPECLDFHHMEKSKKEFHVAAIRIRSKRTKAQVLEEIKKCVVLCANCHRIEHAKKRLEKAA